MKEGIGGTFMIYVFLIFLAVYVCFIAVAFNYARAFKVKNKIIDIIEQNEGINFENTAGAMDEIENYLSNAKYRVTGIDSNKCPEGEYEIMDRGYCIGRVSHTNGEYYKVKTFVELKIPFLDWFSFTIPVKGETRMIGRINA